MKKLYSLILILSFVSPFSAHASEGLLPLQNRLLQEDHAPNSHNKRSKYLILGAMGLAVLGSSLAIIYSSSQNHIISMSPKYDLKDDLPSLAVNNTEPGDTKRANIFGFDDRIIETSGDFPFSAIGLIQFQDEASRNYICTGTLVENDKVLTAAHCVTDDDGNLYKNIIFGAGTIDGRTHPNAISRAKHIVFDSRYPRRSPSSFINYSFDWAVIHLERDLGTTQGTLGVQDLDYQEGENINLAGYSGDINGGRSISHHAKCTIRSDQSDESYAYDCDMAGGSSGSGILTGNYKYIIAVNSHNFCNGNCDITHWDFYLHSARNVGIDVKPALEYINRYNNRPLHQTIEPGCVESPLRASTSDRGERSNCTEYLLGKGLLDDPFSSSSPKLSNLFMTVFISSAVLYLNAA